MRIVFGDAVRAHTTIRQRTLDRRGVDGVTVVVNEHATIFERVLREISGGAPQHSAVNVLVVVSLVRIIEHGAGPVHDECAATAMMALRIVVRHPKAFACPSHTKLQMGAVRLAGHVEHARLAPMERIVGFPDDEIRAGVVAPLVPAAAVASEHTRASVAMIYHVPVSGLRMICGSRTPVVPSGEASTGFPSLSGTQRCGLSPSDISM